MRPLRSFRRCSRGVQVRLAKASGARMGRRAGPFTIRAILAFATHYDFRPRPVVAFTQRQAAGGTGFWNWSAASSVAAPSVTSRTSLQLGIWLDGTCDRRRHDKTKRTARSVCRRTAQSAGFARAPLRHGPGLLSGGLHRWIRVLDGQSLRRSYDHVTDILPIPRDPERDLHLRRGLAPLGTAGMAGRGQGSMWHHRFFTTMLPDPPPY